MSNIEEPIQKRAIEKKIHLIKAAKKVFNTKGYHHTYIKDITNEAGVSVGLFYKYFEDKNDIYTLILNTLFKSTIESAETFKFNIIHSENKKEAICSYLKDQLEMTTYKIIIQEGYVLSEKIDFIKHLKFNYHETYLNLLRDMLFELWENPTVNDVDITSRIIHTTVFSNAFEIESCDSEDLKNQYIEYLVDLLYHLIFKTKG